MHYLINVHVSVSFFESFGGLSHGLEDGRVGVGALQRFPLLLDGRQGTVNLLKLSVISLLSFECLEISKVKIN